MPTGGLLLNKEDLQRHEAARRAVKNARKLKHGWQTMARMMSRNQSMKVELTSGATSCTDGKTVFIKVPAELGEDLVHDINLCQHRDEWLVPLCHACQVIEDVNITVIHEVSHIIFGTFENVTAYERAQLLERAIQSECNNKPDSKRAMALKRRIETAPPEKKADYLNLSDIISPYLPFLINCCEDIRVNTLMQQERPGTRKMFDAQINRVFRDGIKNYDGSVTLWRNQPPNAQAAIGVYCKVGGFHYNGWLAEEIEKALDDPGLDALCDRMRNARSMREVYRMAFPLLEKLRELGFMKVPDEPEDEPATPPMNEEQDEQEEDEQGDSSSEEGSPGDNEGSPPEGPAQPADSPGEEGDSGSPSQGEQESSEDGASSGEAGGGGEPSDAGSDSGDSDSAGDDGDNPSEPAGSPGNSASDSDDGSTSPGEGGSGPDERGAGGAPEDSEEAGDSGSQGDSPEGEGSAPDADGGGGTSSDDGLDSAPEAPDGDSDGSSGGDAVGEGPLAGEVPPTGEASSESGESDSDVPEERQDTPAEADAGAEAPAPVDGPEGDGPEADDAAQDGPGGDGNEAPVPSATDEAGQPDSTGKDSQEVPGTFPEPYTAEDQERDGLPEDIEHLFKLFGMHGESSPSEAVEETKMDEAVRITLDQIDRFDGPSLRIEGLDVVRFDDGSEHLAFGHGFREVSSKDLDVPEQIIVGSLQRLRLVFQDNHRGKTEADLRRGKVNTRALARRVPIGDDRLFKKTLQPGRKDYFVVIGIDCSGSTSAPSEGDYRSPRLDLMKQAVYAKAEMLSRLGIPFALYAHSGSRHRVEIFEIKSDREPWGKKQKEALASLQPYSANLDGHTLEFYRKVAQARTETDRLILYYTDGAMPAANKQEELEILIREIKMCKDLGIHLVGIGVNSDAPLEHGLDTILLDGMADVKKVVKGLQERLMR